MTDKPNLADARRVTEAASTAPWEAFGSDFRATRGHSVRSAPSGMVVSFGGYGPDGGTAHADAEFIAASRTLVPALLAAVDAVLALHRPSPRWVFARDEHVTICETCTNTEVARSRAVMWPCPTVRAITAHLDIEPR